MFKGCCANCHHSSEGSRRSFRDRKYVLQTDMMIHLINESDRGDRRQQQSGLVIGVFGFGSPSSDAGCRSPRPANGNSFDELIAISGQ